MKTKYILFAFFMVSAAFLRASEDKPDIVSIFDHPTAVIKMSGDGWFGRGVTSENFSRMTKPQIGSWVFSNGLGKSDEKDSSEFISYKFIAKCEYGDIYIAEFTLKDGKKEVVPFVYDGKNPVSIERNGLLLEISESKKD